MALAFDSAAKLTEGFLSSPATFSHTFTGSNGLVLLFIKENGTGSITTVTYGGNPMTQLKTVAPGDTSYAYGLLNPSAGANTVSITFTGGTQFIRAIALSYTGVKQSGLPDATASNTSAGTTSLATTITTIADNAWVAGMCDYDTKTSITGATDRLDSATNISAFDSNGVIHPAGSDTVTVNGTNVRVNMLVSFAPLVTASGGGLMLMGVGS